MAAQRLFFALWPDEPFSQHVAQIVAQGAWSKQGSKVPVQNLHLTLAFLGDVEEARLGQIIALADGIAAPEFELIFDHLGYWKKPQVVWAGVSAVPPALMQLAHDLQAGLRTLNLPVDERDYVPHLTLLRKVARRPPLSPIKGRVWRVTSFCLIRSQLTPAGSQYQVVKSWALL